MSTSGGKFHLHATFNAQGSNSRYTQIENPRKHVLRDLRPFICTFEKCSQPDRLFRNEKEWYQHELQFHRREWVCRITACGIIFRDLHEFRLHLEADHSKVLDELVLDQCERETTLPADQCPFCAVTIPMDKMRTHMGNHLIDCALSALPRVPLETEDDSSLKMVQPFNSGEKFHTEDQDIHSKGLNSALSSKGRQFGPSSAHGDPAVGEDAKPSPYENPTAGNPLAAGNLESDINPNMTLDIEGEYHNRRTSNPVY